MPDAIDTVDKYLDRIEHLPSAPTVVFDLLNLFKQPDCHIDRIVELITRDPSLTAEVLKLANSTLFGSEYRVRDVFAAVTRIGFYDIYRMVVAVAGSEVMRSLKGPGAVPLQALWKHSVISAVAGERIARRVREDEAVAFTAALLHDIGKIVLASLEGEIFAALLAHAGHSEQSLVEAERAAFKTDHAEIGARLLSRWNVTANLVVAAQFHHTPALATPHERLAATVHLANVISYSLAGESGIAPAEFRSGAISLGILGLGDAEARELTEQTEHAVKEESGLLNL